MAPRQDKKYFRGRDIVAMAKKHTEACGVLRHDLHDASCRALCSSGFSALVLAMTTACKSVATHLAENGLNPV